MVLINGPIYGFTQTPENTPGEKTDSVLVQKLEDLIKDFQGDVGIYVRHLPSGRTAAVQADEIYPTASMIMKAMS